MKSELISKYNVPGPRYTSYPTVPYWDNDSFEVNNWKTHVRNCFSASNDKDGISLYIHLLFCESLCTFCACHKQVTKKHEVELPYINAILKEWDLYIETFGSKPTIKELHLGGGTPTFFSPKNLSYLIKQILIKSNLSSDYKFSFEAHPKSTSIEHLKTLFDLGFRRLSLGVQDYNEKVQKAINRFQSFDLVKECTEKAREIGYESISHDLVFGLPHQNLKSMINTILKTIKLKPDRLSFYSYAHVPWVKGVGQRGFSKLDLPKDNEKRALYEEGKLLLCENGYVEIGMDSFTLKSDSMYEALKFNKLHRNFMGYTSESTELLVGLGASAISDTWTSFGQNTKNLKDYYSLLKANKLPIYRGHELTKDEMIIRRHIINIMCNLNTSWKLDSQKFTGIESCIKRLKVLEEDGIIKINDSGLTVVEDSRAFIRNICMAFDLKLINSTSNENKFSMTI